MINTVTTIVGVFFLSVAALGLGMYLAIQADRATQFDVYREELCPPSKAETCKTLYNVDKHRAWAECMGVPYRTVKEGQSSEFSEFIRNASPEEKERVYSRVIDEANKAQNAAVKDKT